MWKWYIVWIFVLTGLMTMVFIRGIHPKPITKIQLSKFPSTEAIATAVHKRLFFEVEKAKTLFVGGFSTQPWMREFAHALSNKFPGSPVISFIENMNPEFNFDKGQYQLFLINMDEIGPQPESCSKLQGKALVYCHSNGFKWRLRKKHNYLNSANYLVQVEQLALGSYAIYVKLKDQRPN